MFLYRIIYLQAPLQCIKYLLRLLYTLFGCTNLKACFLEGNSLLGSKYIFWNLNLSITDKLFSLLRNFSIIKYSYRLAPTRKYYLSCIASLFEHLTTHTTTLPINLTNGILGSLCLISARQFTDWDFAFNNNDIGTNPRRLKLVVQWRARHMPIGIIGSVHVCSLLASSILTALVELELPFQFSCLLINLLLTGLRINVRDSQVGVLVGTNPCTQLICFNQLAVHGCRHRRI